MLTLHLHWGQEEIQKGHVACFEGVKDINKEVKQGNSRKTFKGNCDEDDKCEVFRATRACVGRRGLV